MSHRCFLPKRPGQRTADRLGDGRRQSVADLPVGRGLPTGQLPRVGEALDPRGHAYGESRHRSGREVMGRRTVGQGETVHPEATPSGSRPSRPEVRPTVLFRPSHQGGRNSVRSPSPFARRGPATLPHQIDQAFSDRLCYPSSSRPLEVRGELLPQSDQNEPGPQLSHPVFARIKDLPVNPVPERVKILRKRSAIRDKASGSKPWYILQKHGLGSGALDQLQRRGKEVPVVVRSQLLSGHRERRTRHAAREQVYTGGLFLPLGGRGYGEGSES